MPRFVGYALAGFLLIGVCASQDTNFTAGPQYLMNYGSPQFLHPISTPTLSLSAPPATAGSAPAEEGTGEPNTPVFGGFRSQAAIDRIYWGVPTASPSVIRTGNEESGQTSAATSETSSEIELSSGVPSRSLPASIMDTGTAAMTNAQSLREIGIGVPVGEAASYWKANKPQGVRVYTNADIARLHGN